MSRRLRRCALALMWLLLTLLPQRGWANLTMHLPTSAAAQTAPCHEMQAPPAADPVDITKPCSLCDVCHGAMLPLAGLESQGEDRRAQPLPSALSVAVPVAETDGPFRPPRR